MSGRGHDNGNFTGAAVDGGEDRIGALPDDVLKYLLSFLPSRNAVRTCVLAKRWRMLWKSAPALRIKDDPQGFRGSKDPSESEDESDDEPDKSIFADKLLQHRDHATPLNVCEIYSSYYYANRTFDDDNDDYNYYNNILDRCTHMEAFDRIEPWIRYALSHDIRVLQVNCDSTVTNLALVSSHLKRVELTAMLFQSSLDFSSCPLLDVLKLTSCGICANILSQSLRHLNIEDVSFAYDTHSRISVPNLITLKLDQDGGVPSLLDSMPSLATASVHESNDCKQSAEESFSVLLEGLSSATNLELITPRYQNYYLIETYESSNSREQAYNSRDQSLLLKHLKVVIFLRGKKDDVIVQRILNILCTHGVPSEQIDIQ